MSPRTTPPLVAIRGAGPVGCVLALALRAAGCRVALTARRRPPSVAPFRPLALSYASRLILERVGAWCGLATTPIATVHVSQAQGFGRARLEAADAGVPALGDVVDYGALANVLLAQVEAAGIAAAEREPALTVHAEGSAPDASETHYDQEAVLALVATRPAAQATAYERFTPEGPLALLPFAGRYAVVWATSPARARALLDAAESDFLRALARAFGARAGSFLSASHRSCLPLALRVRPSRVAPREVYVGNAAQTLHPVAGQGLNLGLRDAWDLACILRDAPDPGDERLLARYAGRRRFDAAAAIRLTDFLAGAFVGADPLSAAARGAALAALDACAPLRRFLARRMIFGASAVP